MELKRLGFVNNIAVKTFTYVSNTYVYTKCKVPMFDCVERVVGPVYENFKPIPGCVLVILDNTVDQGLNKFEEHAPSPVKWGINKALLMTQMTSMVAQTFVQKFQTNGPCAAIQYSGFVVARLMLILLANIWYMLNQITPFHVVARMTTPTAVKWTETYNKKIKVGEGHTVFNLPSIPSEEFRRAHKQVEAERGPVCTVCN